MEIHFTVDGKPLCCLMKNQSHISFLILWRWTTWQHNALQVSLIDYLTQTCVQRQVFRWEELLLVAQQAYQLQGWWVLTGTGLGAAGPSISNLTPRAGVGDHKGCKGLCLKWSLSSYAGPGSVFSLCQVLYPVGLTRWPRIFFLLLA